MTAFGTINGIISCVTALAKRLASGLLVEGIVADRYLAMVALQRDQS